MGIFVTVVDRALSDDTIQNLYVAGDNPGMGKIAAQYLIDKLGGQGNIVVLRGLRAFSFLFAMQLTV
jgi:ribose transport system substrate-binding protein